VQADLAGMRALVTGAAGFIGSSLALALVERGAEVHALVRPGARLDRLARAAREPALHEVDLRQGDEVERILRAARVSVIFHLAATSGHPETAPERAAMLADTVTGTANLLDAAAVVPPVRFVHVGSSL